MSEKNSSSNELLIYFVVGLVSAIFLLISVLIYEDHKTVASFLKELSFAGFIALIVIFTVERFSKERHRLETESLVRDINKNLFHAIYSRYIPNKVFREVERLLLNVDVYRKGYSVIYTIEDIEGDPIHYKCTAQSSYEIENLTEEPIDHSVGLALEKPLNDGMVGLCRIDSVKIGDKQLSQEEIAEHTTVSETQVVLSYPIKIPSRSSVKVNQIGSLIKLKTDQELWLSRVPSDGFRLTVFVPKGVNVYANAVHSGAAELVHDAGTKKAWEINEGMIPCQGFVFWWVT